MTCAYEGCDRERISSKPLGRYCKAHWYQKHVGQPLRPIKQRLVLAQTAAGRECTKCRQFKTWDEFYTRTGGNGYQSACKTCFKTRQVAFRASRKAVEPLTPPGTSDDTRETATAISGASSGGG